MIPTTACFVFIASSCRSRELLRAFARSSSRDQSGRCGVLPGCRGKGLDAYLSVAQQLTRRCASALAIFKRDLTVDDSPAIAFGALDPPPFVGREVVDSLKLPFGRALESFQIIDNDISRRAFAQETAIDKAGCLRRQIAKMIVRFFERHFAGVAHEPGQEVGGIGAAGEKFGVSAAVRDPGYHIWVTHQWADLFGVVAGCSTGSKHDLKVTGY